MSDEHNPRVLGVAGHALAARCNLALPRRANREQYVTKRKQARKSVNCRTRCSDIDDPEGVLNIVGHRRVWAIEDSAPIGQQMVFWGYTADRDVTRTSPQVQASRKWTATIVDINSLLQRKVMAGNDTDRPEETDVERVQWLMTTGEAGFFDDTTTAYVTERVETGGGKKKMPNASVWWRRRWASRISTAVLASPTV